jgi:hypothetical protein
VNGSVVADGWNSSSDPLSKGGRGEQPLSEGCSNLSLVTKQAESTHGVLRLEPDEGQPHVRFFF